LSHNGIKVDLYDAMPSLGRKFLMAGKGGMNITHSEPMAPFISRYGSRKTQIAPLLDAFRPDALREWIHGLDVETFVGSSGRVFPRDMKAAPLLRAWLHRLRSNGVSFHVRHRWQGWDADNRLKFSTPDGEITLEADAVVLALGGGSWARLGSDGAWTGWLKQRGIAVNELVPANCGFNVAWSAYFKERFAGQPLKSIALSYADTSGVEHRRQGEFLITATGVEGSLIYATSADLRDKITADSEALIYIDLLPDRSEQQVIAEVSHPRGSRSMASHLQSRLGLKGIKASLLRELLQAETFTDPALLGAAIKRVPLRLISTRPLDEAISSAGGVAFEDMDEHLMIRALPGLFCAGEMLDWEAPTGGYLLTACFASGFAAANGVLSWLNKKTQPELG